jgi:hypothetical protein
MTTALSSQVAIARAEKVRTLERAVNVRPRGRRFRRTAPRAGTPLAAPRRRVA